MQCDALETSDIEVKFVLRLTVVLVELVQIISEELGDNKKMLFVVEVVIYLEEVVLVQIFSVVLYIS